MNPLPSISHRLFVAAVGRPKSDSEKSAGRDPAAQARDRKTPSDGNAPVPNTSQPRPDVAFQQWLQPPANSGI